MKTIIKKLSIVILTAIIFIFGCSKSFLDTQPSGVITPDQFYKTDADATAAIMACYNLLEATYSSPSWNSMWMLKTFATDEVYSAGSKLGDQPAADEINQFKFASNNAIISDVYKLQYFIINRANLVIDNFKPEDAYKKAVIAEAKTLRAYSYFELVTMWGPVPIVLHQLNPSQYAQSNDTISKIWAQIEADLNAAIPDLPVKSGLAAIGMDISRVSKGTAQSFLGKALLYEKKFADAAIQFQAVIDSKEYSLYPDFSQILKKPTEWGTESIFEINFISSQNNQWSSANLWSDPNYTALDNRIWQLCGPRGDEGFSGGTSGLNGGWGFGYPTESIYNAFIAANDTVRRLASIMTEAELISKYNGRYRITTDSANVKSALPYGCDGLVRLKYSTWASETSDPSVGQPELNYGTNVRVIRYADILLMAAEAYNGQGAGTNDGKALLLINQVRARVSLPALSSSGASLFNDIKTERQLELAFEGVRFQDLIRWGEATTVLANQCKIIPTGQILGTQVWHPGHLLPDKSWEHGYITGGTIGTMAIGGAGFKPNNILFPFPFSDIQSNQGKLKQNPGY